MGKTANSVCEGLLTEQLKVVNVGLEGFVEDLRSCGIEVVHVDCFGIDLEGLHIARTRHCHGD